MKINNYNSDDDMFIKCDEETERYLFKNGLMYVCKIIENNVEYFIFFKTKKLISLLERR